MHRRVDRWARAAAALIALTVLAAACGNADDDGSASGSGSGSSPDTTAAADGGSTGTTEAGDGGSSAGGDRDTFVPLSGVPGVSDEEIAFVAFGTNSNNPLGTCVLDCYAQGIEAYFTWRNEEGGIYGRELVLADVIDDELARNLERAQDIAAANEHFAAFSATQVASGWAVLDAAGVPLFVWSIHPEANGREHVWGYTAADCYDCLNRSYAWFAKETGAQVVASLGYGVSENSKLCAAAQRDTIEAYSEDIGGTTVGYFNDDLAFGLPNGVGPEVTAMKNAGVDLILSCLDLNAMKTIGNELQRQGMDDVVMVHANTYNQQFVAEAGGIFEGDYILTTSVPFEYDTGLELQERFLEYMEKAGAELSELAWYGWLNAHQAFEGLLLAGPEFDREKVTAARNQLTADSIGGLVNPIDWTRQHVPPTKDDPFTNGYAQECFSGVKVVNGVFEPIVEDETKPFLCWPPGSEEWSDPLPTSFG